MGDSTRPEYAIWAGMKRRCGNTRDASFKHYGGRGITVCPQWAESFAQFYADMGPRPADKDSIDRINNDGNYEPGNCRWATNTEQANNRRPRPPRPTTPPQTVTIGVRMSCAEERALKASAAVRGLTFSEYLRRQLKLQVKRKPGPVRKERKNG